MSEIRTILHATDLSENSRPAFHLARALARDYQAQLVLLHVYPPPVNAAEAVDRRRPGGDVAEDLLTKLRDLVPQDQSIPVEYRVEEGDPAKVIVDAARQCDLIVIGTHGRRGLRHLLVGSVAEKVMREAPCPVLTVRPAAHMPMDASSAPARAGTTGVEADNVELGTGD